MEAVKIHTEYITLGQFLKYQNIAASGGDIKAILATYKILVNGEIDNRRGKKLYPDDIIEIDSIGTFKITT